jgi:hypothetical protein
MIMNEHKLYFTLSVATLAPRCAQHSAGESLRRLQRDSSLPHLHCTTPALAGGASVGRSHRHGVLRENDIVFLMLGTPIWFIGRTSGQTQARAIETCFVS